MTTVSPVSFFPPTGASNVDGALPGDGNDDFAVALSQTTRKLTGDEGRSEASTDKAPSGDSIGGSENADDADAFVSESATVTMVEGGVGGTGGREQLSASDAGVDALDVQGVTKGLSARMRSLPRPTQREALSLDLPQRSGRQVSQRRRL